MRTLRVYRKCRKYIAVQSVSDTGHKDSTKRISVHSHRKIVIKSRLLKNYKPT